MSNERVRASGRPGPGGGTGGHRRRFGGVSALGVLAVAAIAAVGCSSDEGASQPPPTTTADPLAEQVVDACGHDLSALTSTVWAIDPTDGTVRWSTEVPLAENYLLSSSEGDPQLSLELRSVEVVVDAATGEIVDTPPAGAHEVLVDTTGATASGVGGLMVDGTPQPATIEVDGRRITTAAGETGQTTVGVTAVDAASSAPAWRVEVGAADRVGSLSAPVLYGDAVVVVTSPPRPDCLG
ncbi:MAG TPA: hypothetical protein VIY72_09725 [Acidimicrobiales bacterium]